MTPQVTQVSPPHTSYLPELLKTFSEGRTYSQLSQLLHSARIPWQGPGITQAMGVTMFQQVST